MAGLNRSDITLKLETFSWMNVCQPLILSYVLKTEVVASKDKFHECLRRHLLHHVYELENGSFLVYEGAEFTFKRLCYRLLLCY